jgi:hypothetical protein
MTLAVTCWSKLTLDWHGPFSLCFEELARVPEGLAGVYVLSAFVPARPALTAFYAGQSRNLRRRLGEHLVGRRTFARHLRSRLSTYFSVAAVFDVQLRTATEAALIWHLQPAGNCVTPRAMPVEVNLPQLKLFNISDGSFPT